MKTRKRELNVDFIGGADSLTKEEEKRISDIIKNHKVMAQRPKRKLTTKMRVKA